MESSCFSSFSSDLEAGRAPSYDLCCHPLPPLCPVPHGLGPQSPPKARFFCGGLDDDAPHHFLDACFLCRTPLVGNRDIFMYRGDMPFCSEECRQEQIEMDEGKEMNRKLSLKAFSRNDSNKAPGGGAPSPPKSHKLHVRTRTMVAAS